MQNKYEELSTNIIDLVGGKENITHFTHCVTRLRFNVKDKSKVKNDEIAKINTVVGTNWSGNQYQVIIGQDVGTAYNEVCQKNDMQKMDSDDKKLSGDEGEKKKFSIKKLGNQILAYISPIMYGILPIMIGASMCKTLAVVFGPTVLNVLTEESDLYILFNMLYNAFFYFLPMYLGYLAAKSLNADRTLGIFVGAMIMVPDFIAMVGVRETFSIYGIPVLVGNYAQTFLPVILGVWFMTYIYKFLKKVIPEVVSTIFVPTLTILIMALIMFAVCAPLGSYLGQAIGNLLIALAGSNFVVRLIAYVLLGVLFPYIVLGGMHMVLINFAIMTFLANGSESFVLAVMWAYSFGVYGVAVGVMLKEKRGDKKATLLSYAATGLLAGVSEPILYGVVLKYKNALKALAIASALGSLYCGIVQPAQYIAGSLCNVFSAVPGWLAGGLANTINGMIVIVLSFVAGIILSYTMVDAREN